MAVIDPQVAKVYRRASQRPWETATGLTRIAPHVWYVGQEWVGVPVIDCGDCVTLIDSGIRSNMWQIFECVRKLGYDPEKDIRLCLLSHAHLDHCSGMSLLMEYSHPVMYMSPFEADWPANPEKYYAHYPVEIDQFIPFTPDRFFDYKTPIVCGNMTFEVLHTPGHTVGTSSFFFDDTDEEGNTYRVGLHGGMGLNYLTDLNYGPDEAERAAKERGIYREMALGLLGKPVDITITNHAPNMGLFERSNGDKNDFRPYIDPGYWDMHIQRYLKKLDVLEAESKFHS